MKMKGVASIDSKVLAGICLLPETLLNFQAFDTIKGAAVGRVLMESNAFMRL